MKKSILAIVLLFTLQSSGQEQIRLDKIEPPFWLDGFHDPDLLLIVYGKNISGTDVSIPGEDIRLERVITTGDTNYLLLEVHFTSPPVTGNFPITFTKDKKFITEYLFEIRSGPAPVNGRKTVANPVYVSSSPADSYRLETVYQLDRRYLSLADTLHSKNEELVFTTGLEIGTGHQWASRPPSPGWISVSRTSRTSQVRIKSNVFSDKYLVQNCLWWSAILQPDAVCVSGQSEEELKYYELVKKTFELEFPGLPVIKDCTK